MPIGSKIKRMGRHLLRNGPFEKPGRSFGEHLERTKKTIDPSQFSFYAYGSLHVARILDDLLSEPGATAYFGDLKGTTIADVGAGDGYLGYFLESLGAEIDFVDYPPTNWNQMQGIRALREALKSKASIHEIDLDSQFRMPRTKYDVVFLLGILYHLKNPYYVLEHLRSVSQKLVISTRVAKFTRSGGNDMQADPVAYLVAPDECNNDSTNYWIFSEKGLHQILDRTGWDVVSQLNYGDTEHSNPQDNEHNERIFMLLERR